MNKIWKKLISKNQFNNNNNSNNNNSNNHSVHKLKKKKLIFDIKLINIYINYQPAPNVDISFYLYYTTKS